MGGALYGKVKDLLSREEFEDRVARELEAWEGLLDPDVAALLVVDELGRHEVTFGAVTDLYEGAEALLQVEVEEIGEIREFNRRDGTAGRVVNLVVADATGRCRLVLWDEEVDLVVSGRIQAGDRLRVIDGLVRRSDFGLEVSTGKWGVLLPSRS